MSKKVLVAGKIPKSGLKILEENCDVVEIYENEELISKEELMDKLEDKDALLSLLSTPVDEEVINSASNLKVIANYGAGYNNIDFKYAASKNIPVSNTPGVSTETTADLTFSLVLSAARRIVEGDKICRTVGFSGWAPLFHLGRDVNGKTIGIIGFGSIGQAVAKRAAKGFDMNVLYSDLNKKSEEVEKDLNATYVDLDELLEKSDFITINCSYNEKMKHMISKEEINSMKKTAYLINAARGPIVEEKALIEALKNNNIAGAGLDVFEFEPKIGEELKTLDNVVLTPHIGNASIETRGAMSEIAAKNIVSVLNGNDAVSQVN